MSKQKEQETEDHMLKLAEREQGRLKQDIERIERELNELKERENSYEVLYIRHGPVSCSCNCNSVVGWVAGRASGL